MAAPLTLSSPTSFGAGLEKLLQHTGAYLEAGELELLERAYKFSAKAHSGQQRHSGEPYIQHPLAVALVLAEWHLDVHVLMAGLLHDVVEDTSVDCESLRREFGGEVAVLVDGVTKLTRIKVENREQEDADSLCKMLLAMNEDVRVFLIKLADRLHNMRTVKYLSLPRRYRAAHETLEIYAPLAYRLGMSEVGRELEEHSFKTSNPNSWSELEQRMRKLREQRRGIVDRVERALCERLAQENIKAALHRREKHLYGIHRKMILKGLGFQEVYDIQGFRMIVNSVATCYLALGTAHNLYKPVPGRFKDYIALPKSNGYQSLHTVLIGPYGIAFELQIRTREMDQLAESGIAAHWLYKLNKQPGRDNAADRARNLFPNLHDLQGKTVDSVELMEQVKQELARSSEIYVFTPKSDVFKLPRGATPVDLAYAIHTDVGNRCVGAEIEGFPVSLRSRLLNGQTLHILTDEKAYPNPTWLNFIVTPRARIGIRHRLKTLRHWEARDLGRRLLEKELEVFQLQLGDEMRGALEQLLNKHQLPDREALFVKLGFGDLPAPIVARALASQHNPKTLIGKRAPAPLPILGTEGMVVNFPRCCLPLPGDSIVGLLSRGRGLVIHRESCGNASGAARRGEGLVDVCWNTDIDREFNVQLRLHVVNQRGVLATIAAAISEKEANIVDVKLKETWDIHTILIFELQVRDLSQMESILARLKQLEHVNEVRRV